MHRNDIWDYFVWVKITVHDLVHGKGYHGSNLALLYGDIPHVNIDTLVAIMFIYHINTCTLVSILHCNMYVHIDTVQWLKSYIM